jgi:hypothetical protein
MSGEAPGKPANPQLIRAARPVPLPPKVTPGAPLVVPPDGPLRRTQRRAWQLVSIAVAIVVLVGAAALVHREILWGWP